MFWKGALRDLLGVRKLDPERVVDGVGRRVAELRRERGWTQAELGERVNFTFQYIARIEGGVNLTIHSLTHLANAFRVPISALFEPPTEAGPRRPGRPRKTKA